MYTLRDFDFLGGIFLEGMTLIQPLVTMVLLTPDRLIVASVVVTKSSGDSLR